MKTAHKSANLMVCLLLAATAAGTQQLSAQVSLGTVVDLAQRNSAAVRVAMADVNKADAVLSESKDVYIPSISFSSGIPAFPEEGFTGQPPSIWSGTVQSLVFSIPQKYYTNSAHSGRRAALARLKDAREQAALDASSAYIELDAVRREIEAARAQEDLASHMMEIEQQRAEAAVDPLRKLLQAKLTAANLKVGRLHLEARIATLTKQLEVLTGLNMGKIVPDGASIPEVPSLRGDVKPATLFGIEAAHEVARARQQQARGDQDTSYYPQLSFFGQYNRNTTLLNSVNSYFARPLPTNNFASGFSVQIPLFDMGHRAKGRESAADALRATVEAEQAERQNDQQIADLTGTLRELDAQAEVASLKQQIAADELKTVQAQLENGNGAGAAAGTNEQLSPRQEDLARIDERQKYVEAQEAALELAKTRLGLLRALGHMQDWLNEVHTK